MKKTTIILIAGLVLVFVFVLGFKEVKAGEKVWWRTGACDPNPSGPCKTKCTSLYGDQDVKVYMITGSFQETLVRNGKERTNSNGRVIVEMKYNNGQDLPSYSEYYIYAGNSVAKHEVKSGAGCYDPCGPWNGCTAYCGGGQKTKQCTNLDGVTYTETGSESCNTQDCCGVWGACSVSCGSGKQYKTCKENIVVAKDTKWEFTLYNMPVTRSQDCSSTDGCAPIVPDAIISPATPPPSTPPPSAPASSSSDLPSCSFSSSPSSIPKYSKSTLSWKCSNADSCSINQGVGSASPASSGSIQVSPKTTTTYTLSCSGPGGDITKTTKVTILKMQVREVWP